MSKKHYEALANALARVRPNCTSDCLNAMAEYAAERVLWQALVNDIANVCSRFNPRFDRQRFIDACETR